MTVELNRLRWQCRRGHLELDLLLQRFLDKAYASLDATSQAAFVQLLTQGDEKLFAWLIQNEPVSEKEFRDIVARIRAS